MDIPLAVCKIRYLPSFLLIDNEVNPISAEVWKHIQNTKGREEFAPRQKK